MTPGGRDGPDLGHLKQQAKDLRRDCWTSIPPPRWPPRSGRVDALPAAHGRARRRGVRHLLANLPTTAALDRLLAVTR